MKKNLRAISLLLGICMVLAVMPLTLAASGNLVANPGFEEEGGWLTFLDQQVLSESGDPVHGGSFSFKLPKEHNGLKLLEKIQYVSGAELSVSFWTYGKSMILFGLYTSGGAFVDYQYTDIEGGEAGKWTEVTGTVILGDYEGIGLIDAQFLNREDAGNVFLDDITITSAQIGSTESPGSSGSSGSSGTSGSPRTGDAAILAVMSVMAISGLGIGILKRKPEKQ